MSEFLYELFRNEYIFTFFTSFLAISLKSISTKEFNKKSLDLGLELIIIALSFCAGNIAQLNGKIIEYQENINQLVKYKNESKNNILELNRLSNVEMKLEEEIMKMQSYSDHYFVLAYSFISLLFVTSLMIRSYKNVIPDETSFLYQIVIPNVIGSFAVAWAVLFSF